MRLAFKALPLVAAVVLAGCVSLEIAAPRVETLPLLPSGGNRVQLEQGRTIYITKCAKCHSPEPVHRYTSSQWDVILPDMIGETNLDTAESAAVSAYVYAVLGQ